MSSLGELSISGHVAQPGDADWEGARGDKMIGASHELAVTAA